MVGETDAVDVEVVTLGSDKGRGLGHSGQFTVQHVQGGQLGADIQDLFHFDGSKSSFNSIFIGEYGLKTIDPDSGKLENYRP